MGMERTRGEEVEDEFSAIHDNGMTGIRPTAGARDNVVVF
jgi:hypothetical protein